MGRFTMNASIKEAMSVNILPARMFCPKLGDSFTIEMVDGKSVLAKVIEQRPAVRETPFIVFRHSIITVIKAGELTAMGIGDDDSESVATIKSAAEAVERLVLQLANKSQHRFQTSNGWAAHCTEDLAQQSSLFELLERDAAMISFHHQTPFKFLRKKWWSLPLQHWDVQLRNLTPFSELKLGILNEGHIPVVSAILIDREGYGLIAFASGETLEDAALKAMTEACRMSEAAFSKRFYLSSAQLKNQGARPLPHDHAVYYAHHEKLPAWIFANETEYDWELQTSIWKDQIKDFKPKIRRSFELIARAPFYVGVSYSPDVQSLYFGNHDDAFIDGQINLARLDGKLNFNQPHFIA